LTAERRHIKLTLHLVGHGKRFNAVLSNGMVKSIRFTPEAEDDSYQGYAWYESRRIGLGREFITAVDACLQSISRNPKLYQTIYKDYRRTIVRRFPFSVIYEETALEVVVYAIFDSYLYSF
jgi:plasmid stabilization system protein ParE